jgi:adenosylcobyric acid synthase
LSAKALMFQGTGSNVGKSLIVAGLCRAFTKRGFKMRPFKPQNMSNNAAVTRDGGEIGRAQALQAQACGIAASVDMNPVLLKPQSGNAAQIVVRGHVLGQAHAADFQAYKPKLLNAVLESFGRLKAEADLVIVEGAGSASEVNLRANDIANMGFARAANMPVVLIGDIDRGGIIAQIVGTKEVIAAEDAAMIVGFLVNKFRGDPKLFDEGMSFIEKRTGWTALGLIPFCAAAGVLPAEDSMALAGRPSKPATPGAVKIAVPILPGIANFDDLDPLRMEPGVSVVLVRSGETLPGDADLILLIGSKTTIADLSSFRAEGWDVDLAAHVRRGGRVFGLCGGYQMLGKKIADPLGLEGAPGEVPGLGLLQVETEMTAEKIVAPVSGRTIADDTPFTGYELHCGRTSGPDCNRPLLRFADGRDDGATSADGRISGCYVHGFFSGDAQRRAFLARLGAASSDVSYAERIEQALDAVAAHLEAHVDLDRLLSLAR